MSENRFDALAEVMRSRHSVKKYQPEVVIPKEEVEEMLALASTAPSSWNLQHWRYIVISSQEAKERILPIAYNQRQVVDSSVTVVILGDLEANKVAPEVYGESLKEGLISQKVHDTLISQIDSAYKNPQVGRDEAILNASLAAMQLMLAAKAKGYDTCPMGGFNDEALIAELKIPSRFIPVMLIVIGKADVPARASSRFVLDKSIVSFTE